MTFPLVQLRHRIRELKTGPFGSALSADEYVEDGVPLLNPSDLICGQISTHNAVMVPESVAARMSAYRVKPGDVILARRGELGRYGLVKEAHEGFLCGTGSLLVRPSSELSPRFLGYFLEAPQARAWLSLQSVGSTMENLSERILARFPLPDLSVIHQERIANFLDEKTARIDALIAEKQKLEESLAEFMAAQLEESFTGAKLQGARRHTGNIFFPELPRSWNSAPLKHLLSTPVADGPHETPEFALEGVPFISAEAIKQGVVDFDKKRGYITTELHDLYCQKIKPQRDDIFMVKSGATTGAVAIVETDDEFSVWSPLAVLRANPEKILPRFLYLAMQTPYFQRSVQLFWSYGTQPNIGMAVIENLAIAFPFISEQHKIIEHIGQLNNRVAELATHCSKHINRLREYRSSLISAAVTGQLDVAAFKDAILEAA